MKLKKLLLLLKNEFFPEPEIQPCGHNPFPSRVQYEHKVFWKNINLFVFTSRIPSLFGREF